MNEEIADELEFTDEQLRAALKRVGREARQQAFAGGRPVFFVKNGSLIALQSHGTEKVVKVLHIGTGAERDE